MWLIPIASQRPTELGQQRMEGWGTTSVGAGQQTALRPWLTNNLFAKGFLYIKFLTEASLCCSGTRYI